MFVSNRSSNIKVIPVSWRFKECQSRYDLWTDCYISEFIVNSEWTLSCSFTKNSKQNSLLTICRRSTASKDLVSGSVSAYNESNYCEGQSSFSHLFKPNDKSALLDLRISVRENFLISGFIKIVEKFEECTNEEVESFCVKKEILQSQDSSFSSRRFEPLKELSDDFSLLLDPKTPFADVLLICESREFPAHKSILSARSPVFRAIFTNKMKASRDCEVNITDIDAPTVQAMLRYVYTGQTENLSDSLAASLLLAAHNYQLEGLKRVTCNYLKTNATPQNVLKLLVLGDLYTQDLKGFAMDFICDKYPEFSVLEKTQEWKALLKKRPNLVIEVLIFLIKSKDKKKDDNKIVILKGKP
ncbi:TD and POZ domain-containing protein 3 [Nephila pilipes]|uniref:TD and POZ domain-containing protein 3 n=1 Tax=Nephila pilipes TaxID=299642 RepID=A0A8X6R3J5_NEPPI|nr:TD and POZ domain-containing protein 3 [Nephila pilipes]